MSAELDPVTHDSRLLFKLCCDLGFSEAQWKKWIWIIDALNTLQNHNEDSDVLRVHYCGSYTEGLAHQLLCSDIDCMLIIKAFEVLESDHQGHRLNPSSSIFQMVPSTHFAFVHLPFLMYGKDSSELDETVTLALCDDCSSIGVALLNGDKVKDMLNIHMGGSKHGPALTSRINMEQKVDIVIALRCPNWPSVSNEWVHRPRQYNWPSEEQVKEIVANGCELVSVGAPNSTTPHLDWRLSSTLAEQVLVRSFNIYQIQCYFLLKVLLVFRIKNLIPYKLCSYHVKTVMLHVAETTQPEEWREDNLVTCLMICLQKLLTFLKERNCPQYFIPQHNLFETRISGRDFDKLVTIVSDMLSEGWKCVLRCSPFNKMNIPTCVHSEIRCPCFVEQSTFLANHMFIFSKFGYSLHRNIIHNMHEAQQTNIQDFVGHLQQLCIHCTTEDNVYRSCKTTNLTIRCHLKSTIGLCRLAQATSFNSEHTNHKRQKLIHVAAKYFTNACKMNTVYCKLKYATFLLFTKEEKRCIDLVQEVVMLCDTTDSVTICYDTDRSSSLLLDEEYLERLRRTHRSVKDIGEAYTHVLIPVTISQWELPSCPSVIQNVARTRILVTTADYECPSVLSVDPLVFAHQLLCIAYLTLGQQGQGRHSLETLKLCVDAPIQKGIFYHDIAKLVYEQCLQLFPPQEIPVPVNMVSMDTCLQGVNQN